MPMTTRKSNAMAHPGAPNLPTSCRQSSKQVAAEKKATKRAQDIQTRLALERLQEVAVIQAQMAQEDAAEQRNAARRNLNPDNCQLLLRSIQRHH
jgi:hypothetical protein